MEFGHIFGLTSSNIRLGNVSFVNIREEKFFIKNIPNFFRHFFSKLFNFSKIPKKQFLTFSQKILSILVNCAKLFCSSRDGLFSKPSVHFWIFFSFFYQKEGVPLHEIFWWNHLNDRFCETQKTECRILFWLFHAETTRECFSRQKKIFFFEKIFSIFSLNFTLTSKQRRPSCDHYTKKISAWYFYL